MRGAGYLAAGAVSGWRSGTSQNRMIQGYIRDCWGTERLTRASSWSGNPYAAVFFQFGLKRFALYVRDWAFAATQTPAPATTGAAASKPAATATAKTTRKHHKKAVKKTVKTPAASAVPAPVKQ